MIRTKIFYDYIAKEVEQGIANFCNENGVTKENLIDVKYSVVPFNASMIFTAMVVYEEVC